jgi:hypothetical protein
VTAIRLLIFAILLESPLSAQNVDFNEVGVEALPAALVQMSGPSTLTKPEKVFDKKFFAVMGSLGGAESFRFTSRKLVLEREFEAGAPWITSVPSNQHIVATDLAVHSSEFLVTYELKKSHSWMPGDHVIRRLWWAYPAAMTAIHIKNAVGNVRTQGPGGCTSIQCAMQMQYLNVR